MPRGVSDYLKVKQQTYKELDDAEVDTTKPAPAPTPTPAPAPVVTPKSKVPAPTPGGGRSLWDWKK
jgi:hypothetical protein